MELNAIGSENRHIPGRERTTRVSDHESASHCGAGVQPARGCYLIFDTGEQHTEHSELPIGECIWIFGLASRHDTMVVLVLDE